MNFIIKMAASEQLSTDIFHLDSSLSERISNIEKLSSKYHFADTCFNVRNIQQDIIGNHGERFKLITIQGEGGYNIAYQICETGDTGNCIDKERYIFRKSLEHPNNDEIMTTSCISDRYSLIFSELVKNNICPNFSLMVGSYLCDNNYTINIPVSIQEFAEEGDLSRYSKQTDDIPSLKKLILQSLLTLHFMNNTLHISHNDAKPSNVLVKSIQLETISYKMDDNFYIDINTDKLALITDFDLTRGSYSDAFNLSTVTYIQHILKFLYKQYADKYTIIPIIHTQNKDKILESINYYLQNRNFIVDIDIMGPNDTEEIQNIKKFAKISEEDNFLSDIISFLIMIFGYSSHRELKHLSYRFLIDFILNRMSFKECIEKYFSDVCIISESYILSSHKKLFSLDTKIEINEDIIHENLIRCIKHNNDYRGEYDGDQYFYTHFNNKYNLIRFLMSHNITDANIEHYITNPNMKIFEKQTAITQSTRVILLNWIKDIVNSLQISNHNNMIMNIFLLVDFVTLHNNIVRSQYQYLGAMCIYLLNNISLSKIMYICAMKTDTNASKIELINMYNIILDTLSAF